jgi:hypothetical protein
VLLGAELDAELERQGSLGQYGEPLSGAAAQRAGAGDGDSVRAMHAADSTSRDVARTVHNCLSAGDDLRRTR